MANFTIPTPSSLPSALGTGNQGGNALVAAANSFVDSYREGRKIARQEEQQAIENRMNKTLLDYKLEQGGLAQNPNYNSALPTDENNTEFTVSPTSLKRAMFMQKMEQDNKLYDTVLSAKSKLATDQGVQVNGLSQTLDPRQENQSNPVGKTDSLLPQSLLPPPQPSLGVNMDLPGLSGPPAASAPQPAGAVPQPPSQPGAQSLLATPIPGLSPSPERQGKILDNQIKERDLSDPSKRLPGPAQENIKALNTQDIKTVTTYQNALEHLKKIRDPKTPNSVKYAESLAAARELTGSESALRGKPYEDLTQSLQNFSDPTVKKKLAGRDYETFADQLEAAAKVLATDHKTNQDTQAKYGYRPPKATGLLEPIPGNKTDAHSQAVDWAKANPKDPRSKTILQMNGM